MPRDSTPSGLETEINVTAGFRGFHPRLLGLDAFGVGAARSRTEPPCGGRLHAAAVQGAHLCAITTTQARNVMADESARPVESKQSPQAVGGDAEREGSRRAFKLWQRLQIAVASVVGYLAVALVGRTLRFEVHGWENWEAARKLGKGLIYTFWHREIFAATWFWRKRGIVVMTSRNFDGEYIARIFIQTQDRPLYNIAEKVGFGDERGAP